jgi:hypothetical protein
MGSGGFSLVNVAQLEDVPRLIFIKKPSNFKI